MKHTLLLLWVLCSMTSCSKMVLSWYDVRQPKQITDRQVQHYALKYGADTQYLYVLDTGFMRELLDTSSRLVEGMTKEKFKMLIQPLQYWLFDNKGAQLKYTANCYAMPGLTGLRFRQGFNAFPPMLDGPVDSAVNFRLLQPYLRPLGNMHQSAEADYTCVVIWSRMMGRNSRRLMRAVDESMQYAGQDKVRVYYVNADAFMASGIE